MQSSVWQDLSTGLPSNLLILPPYQYYLLVWNPLRMYARKKLWSQYEKKSVFQRRRWIYKRPICGNCWYYSVKYRQHGTVHRYGKIMCISIIEGVYDGVLHTILYENVKKLKQSVVCLWFWQGSSNSHYCIYLVKMV